MEEIIVYTSCRHGLGIRILGSRRMSGQRGIYVKELLAGGLAERDGRLKVTITVYEHRTIVVLCRLAIRFYRSTIDPWLASIVKMH